MLRREGLALDDPRIIATTGWTTDELSAGIDRAAPHGPFELVSLLIGVNNQYRGRDLDEYRASLGELGRVYREAIGSHYPAMALVQVAGLVEPSALVEIEATAVIPDTP